MKPQDKEVGVTSEGCNGHYELYGGTKIPDKDGWTYYTCDSCRQEWRTKVITEEL